ncbi:hypothetical protein F383_37099 [Gossypium arboreum]|uniref:Uncharacterized protein n=1 Tax=Gossypium arboreum TaxID=29729 RepID=A0A0B0MB63_GOSAR|nr:hypothetical protein F383_37099 [Gossypium arboreum]
MASVLRYVSQCKTMFGTWHRHGYVTVSVRPCLGHGIDLMDEPV